MTRHQRIRIPQLVLYGAAQLILLFVACIPTVAAAGDELGDDSNPTATEVTKTPEATTLTGDTAGTGGGTGTGGSEGGTGAIPTTNGDAGTLLGVGDTPSDIFNPGARSNYVQGLNRINELDAKLQKMVREKNMSPEEYLKLRLMMAAKVNTDPTKNGDGGGRQNRDPIVSRTKPIQVPQAQPIEITSPTQNENPYVTQGRILYNGEEYTVQQDETPIVVYRSKSAFEDKLDQLGPAVSIQNTVTNTNTNVVAGQVPPAATAPTTTIGINESVESDLENREDENDSLRVDSPSTQSTGAVGGAVEEDGSGFLDLLAQLDENLRKAADQSKEKSPEELFPAEGEGPALADEETGGLTLVGRGFRVLRRGLSGIVDKFGPGDVGTRTGNGVREDTAENGDDFAAVKGLPGERQNTYLLGTDFRWARQLPTAMRAFFPFIFLTLLMGGLVLAFRRFRLTFNHKTSDGDTYEDRF
ncbi:MAG: hypothetical protein R3B54_02840 [Bdellovibrionota bacterium]